MHRAIAIKELRETCLVWGFALAAFALLVISVVFAPSMQCIPFVGSLTNSSLGLNRNFVFTQGTLTTWLTTISVFFTVGLGFYQTLGESARGTYLFLLHRPIARGQVFAVKTAVGLALYLGITSATILAVGIWAATPGTHSSPFEWVMTVEAWRICLAMPMLYLGAFLAGIRPARWCGSRLFPILATGCLCLLLGAVQAWLWIVALITVLVGAWLVACIFHAAEVRDYS